MDDARMAARRAVADEIAALMGRNRVNQTHLAEAVGVTQSYLSRRLAAHKPFTTDDLLAIARHFNVPASQLIPERLGENGRNSACITEGSSALYYSAA